MFHPTYGRSLSDIAPDVANEVREILAHDLVKDEASGVVYLGALADSEYTFLLPPEVIRPDSTPSKVLEQLVDRDVESSLQGVIDYDARADHADRSSSTRTPPPNRGSRPFGLAGGRLFPLRTRGAGHNCLLNAASLGLWGVQDRDLLLRCAVCDTMTGKPSGVKLRERWESELGRSNFADFGFALSDEQYEKEWKEELNRILAPDVSLGPVHVMALAQVLRRPLIVYAQSFVIGGSGEAIDKDRLGGIYLPLMWPADKCCKVPLPMAFTFAAKDVCGHFSALVSVEGPRQEDPPRLPLSRGGQALSIKFRSEADPSSAELLSSYLNLLPMANPPAPAADGESAEIELTHTAVMCTGLTATGPRRLLDSYARKQKFSSRMQKVLLSVILSILAVSWWMGWWPTFLQSRPSPVAASARRGHARGKGQDL